MWEGLVKIAEEEQLDSWPKPDRQTANLLTANASIANRKDTSHEIVHNPKGRKSRKPTLKTICPKLETKL
jgi:hypothetical protein